MSDPQAGGPEQVYLTTAIASTPWEPKASPLHRYLVWGGFVVAILVLAWAAWSVRYLL